MRKLIAALCILMSVEFTSATVAQQWTEYRPAGARFRVEMPGTPEVHFDTIPELGSLKLTQAVVEFGDGWFAASYVDVPPDQIKNASPNSILDTARDTTIKWLVSRNETQQQRQPRDVGSRKGSTQPTAPPSLPGLTPQVGLARLAALNDAELGQARVPMQSIQSS